jgi:hypothetical protein
MKDREQDMLNFKNRLNVDELSQRCFETLIHFVIIFTAIFDASTI